MAAADKSKRNPDLPEDDLPDEELLLDEDAGPVVRPYTLTGGRAVGDADLDLIAMASAVAAGPEKATGLYPEHLAVLGLCRREPLSVAEVSGRLDLPLGVTRVLLSDLRNRRLLVVEEPGAETESPDRAVLEGLLDGLRKL